MKILFLIISFFVFSGLSSPQPPKQTAEQRYHACLDSMKDKIYYFTEKYDYTRADLESLRMWLDSLQLKSIPDMEERIIQCQKRLSELIGKLDFMKIPPERYPHNPQQPQSRSCTGSGWCSANESCVRGRCVGQGDPFNGCHHSLDCPIGEQCVRRTCVGSGEE